MCNPRRVDVVASRELAEAWEYEVRRVISLSGGAVGEARVREALDDSIGAPTLIMLARALEGAEGWERSGDTFRHALDGGYVAYHADSQELEIVAQVSEVVDVEATASEVVRGELRETIEASGTGRYYDDEWGGITEADARAAAHRDAQSSLDARRRDLLERARAEAEDRRAGQLDDAARAQADEELAARTAARSEQLRAAAAQRLTAVGIQGRNAFHRALAEAYRDAILAYARSRGAERVACAERDGVLEIEFELQV